MERLLFVESISVFSANHICMEILLRDPSASIELSHRSYKSTSSDFGLSSLRDCRTLVKLSFIHQRLSSIGRSRSEPGRLEVVSGTSAPSSRAADFILIRMRLRHCLFAEFVINCSKCSVFPRWYSCKIEATYCYKKAFGIYLELLSKKGRASSLSLVKHLRVRVV